MVCAGRRRGAGRRGIDNSKMEKIVMSNRKIGGPDQPPAHEATGYCKPPKKWRFKKCGNSKGRPRGSKNRKTIVKEVASEMHSVTENGKRRRLSTLDLVLLRLRNMALEGNNVRAFNEFHRLDKAYRPQVAGEPLGYIVLSADQTLRSVATTPGPRHRSPSRRPAIIRYWTVHPARRHR